MLERAELLSFDATSYTATVRYAPSRSTVVTGVPVSRAITEGVLLNSDRLAVALFDPGNPTDAMVVGAH